MVEIRAWFPQLLEMEDYEWLKGCACIDIVYGIGLQQHVIIQVQ